MSPHHNFSRYQHIPAWNIIINSTKEQRGRHNFTELAGSTLAPPLRFDLALYIAFGGKPQSPPRYFHFYFLLFLFSPSCFSPFLLPLLSSPYMAYSAFGFPPFWTTHSFSPTPERDWPFKGLFICLIFHWLTLDKQKRTTSSGLWTFNGRVHWVSHFVLKMETVRISETSAIQPTSRGCHHIETWSTLALNRHKILKK